MGCRLFSRMFGSERKKQCIAWNSIVSLFLLFDGLHRCDSERSGRPSSVNDHPITSCKASQADNGYVSGLLLRQDSDAQSVSHSCAFCRRVDDKDTYLFSFVTRIDPCQLTPKQLTEMHAMSKRTAASTQHSFFALLSMPRHLLALHRRLPLLHPLGSQLRHLR